MGLSTMVFYITQSRDYPTSALVDANCAFVARTRVRSSLCVPITTASTAAPCHLQDIKIITK